MTAKYQFRSETLPDLRQTYTNSKFTQEHWHVHQEGFVLDANIVLTDVAWMAKRTNPNAKTELREALFSGALIGYAPTFLLKEIEDNLPKYANAGSFDLEKMRAEWAALQHLITFHDAGESDPSFTADPKDAPYLLLAAYLDAPILSADSDIEKLGGHAMPRITIGHVRNYARHATAEHHLKLMGLGSAHLGSLILPSAFKGMQRLSKAHPKTAIAIAAMLALYVLSSNSRQEKVSKALKTFGNFTLDLFNEHQLAKQAAEVSRNEVAKLRQQTKPVPFNK